ncbi:MAG: tail fiber protein [Mariprofundaceae bacterium]
MSEPFIAEIRPMAFNYAPRGWAMCDGQVLPIAQNQALYSLLGITYGGDGRSTFALPDMRGRVPIHPDAGEFQQGKRGGIEQVQLSEDNLGAHQHPLHASTAAAATNDPTQAVLADTADENTYAAAENLTSLNSSTLNNTGGSQTHENQQPYLTINYCIALTGIYPSRD